MGDLHVKGPSRPVSPPAAITLLSASLEDGSAWPDPDLGEVLTMGEDGPEWTGTLDGGTP